MWILIRVIILNVIASAFWMWFKDTRMGVWFQRKVDKLLTHIANKTDVKALKDADNGDSSNTNV